MSLGLKGKLKAPNKGSFRVVAVDTWEGPFEDCLVGNFDNKDDAIEASNNVAGGPTDP